MTVVITVLISMSAIINAVYSTDHSLGSACEVHNLHFIIKLLKPLIDRGWYLNFSAWFVKNVSIIRTEKDRGGGTHTHTQNPIKNRHNYAACIKNMENFLVA